MYAYNHLNIKNMFYICKYNFLEEIGRITPTDRVTMESKTEKVRNKTMEIFTVGTTHSIIFRSFKTHFFLE